MSEAPSPGEQEDEADKKIVQFRSTRLVEKKMIITSALICGGLIFILWEIVRFPKKFEIRSVFRNKTCLEKRKLCPHGWNQTKKNCFFRYEDEATWDKGHEHCKTYNGSLAKFNDQTEMHSLMYQLNRSSYWIGLNKRNSHKIWTWADESPLDEWYQVPDHGDCAFIHQKGLDSGSCLDLKKFICSRLRYCP